MITVGGLQVASVLHAFVRDEALPGSGVDEAAFWDGVDAILHDLAPRNRELLARRDELQQQLDEWHAKHPGPVGDQAAYVRLPPRDRLPARRARRLQHRRPATSTTRSPSIAGPQLVVPLLNARFATNAVNARWGSLYDALYGTDVVPEDGDLEPGDDYNQGRGDEVIAGGRAFLDEHFPLAAGCHADATAYAVDGDGLAVTVKDDGASGWPTRRSSSATAATRPTPRRVLLVHHGLHVEIQVDRDDTIGGPTRPGSRTCCSRPRSPRSWTSRTRSPRSTPRTRCSATATGCSSTRAPSPRRSPRAGRPSPGR